MQDIKITMDDFDNLMKILEEITMDDDGYIPSEDDLVDYIEKHSDSYYLYLLWFSEHKPIPKDENERKILKRISAIINRTIHIVDEEETENIQDGEDE